MALNYGEAVNTASKQIHRTRGHEVVKILIAQTKSTSSSQEKKKIKKDGSSQPYEFKKIKIYDIVRFNIFDLKIIFQFRT